MLYEKIKQLYPELIDADFSPSTGTIHLQNDSDGKGDYIAKWEHPTLPRPNFGDKAWSFADQADMQYWDKVNGTNNWETAIAAIKAKYPK